MFDDSRGVFWEITPVDVASKSESVGQSRLRELLSYLLYIHKKTDENWFFIYPAVTVNNKFIF